MTAYRGAVDFRHDSEPAVGVLLTNLGTPEAPTPAAVRRYLAEFLADPRVVEVPRALWWVILNGVILRTRPRRSARAYRKVWTEQGSPLLINSLAQRERLEDKLRGSFAGPFEVGLAMRYGQPSVASAMQRMLANGVTRLLVLPLYPQYSATTTASTFDAVARVLERERRIPELRFVDCYHDRPDYIEAVAASIRARRRDYGAGARLLFSFHGIPRRYLLQGDPYHCQCHKTARLVAAALDLDDEAWAVSFQSRLGREEWLRPYTDELLAEWAGSGVEEVDVICPGFSSDCLETLEEVAMQYRELFVGAGGKALHYIPALNASDAHIEMLAGLVTEVAGTWTRQATTPAQRAATLARARALGAAS